MSKSVLISIRPKWCELIASSEKTIEVRKTRPKLEAPFKCYIYCTTGKRDYDKLWILKESVRKAHFDLAAVCANIEKTDDISNGNGKVIGEFVCEKIDKIRRIGCTQNDMRLCVVDESYYCHELDNEYVNKCCISIRDMEEYAKGGILYGWHISDIVIYDTPKELSEFHRPCTPACNFSEECGGTNATDCMFGITSPPQSWCYVEGTDEQHSVGSTILKIEHDPLEKIIPIESKFPHVVCEVMCWECGHRWISVRPEKTLLKELECPNCRKQGFAFATGQTLESDLIES